MTRALFVLEQHLGHQTYAENLRRCVEEQGQISARWVPVTYREPNGLLDHIPGVPERLRGPLRGRAQVRHALNEARYDIAFFNTQVPAALGGSLVRRRPYVIATDITPHQYDQMSHAYNHTPDQPGLLAAYKHMRNTALLRGAGRVLPWSNWVRDSLIRDYGVSPEQIEVLPPGVNLDAWVPGGLRDTGPLRILFVGGDWQRKGGPTLLAAFRNLPRGLAELHLVTRAPIAPEPGVYLYRDLQPNDAQLVHLYRTADVFALPTGAEAFGIAAVEASASGLAIIATAVGGLLDIVADGESGFLVHPSDSDAITAHLRLLAEDRDLCRRMGQAARARAEIRFDARRNTARLVTILLSLAHQGEAKSLLRVT